jgi:hypothetical protein
MAALVAEGRMIHRDIPAVNVLDKATMSHYETVKTYKYPSHPLKTARPIRIIVIGAGLSGIAAVKLFKETFPNGDVELVLYEKNTDVTGTWLENRYPG